MKLLYDNLSIGISKLTTRTYSTSFSLGVFFIDRRLREAIYGIYGFVRLADEVVDSFDGYNKENLLFKLKKETYEAIEDGISVNPILNSFQFTVKTYGIDLELVEAFFQSMEMDLKNTLYSKTKYEHYIFGSAEVIGLMCLHVFTEGDKKIYNELKPYARKLGAAFQKVNFLRDIRDDYYTLGRIYFPGVNLENFAEEDKKEIEKEIENELSFALQGIKKLPTSSRCGVYLSYIIYQSLFKKIKALPANRILNERVRINNGIKVGLMINSFLQYKFKLI